MQKLTAVVVTARDGGRVGTLSVSQVNWKSVQKLPFWLAWLVAKELLPWCCYLGWQGEGGSIEAVEWENRLEKDLLVLNFPLKLPWNCSPRKLTKILSFW